MSDVCVAGGAADGGRVPAAGGGGGGAGAAAGGAAAVTRARGGPPARARPHVSPAHPDHSILTALIYPGYRARCKSAVTPLSDRAIRHIIY